VPRKPTRRNKREVVGLVGIGLDNQDGHHRVTRGEDFVLLGGSAATHERMVTKVVYIHDELEKRGEDLADVSVEELAEILREICGD
jgi:hypothetical protein